VVGQVIVFGRDEDHKYVLSPTWRHFLHYLVDELENGNFLVDSEDDPPELKIKNPPRDHFHDAVPILYAWRGGDP
jgi:hypothetical protein